MRHWASAIMVLCAGLSLSGCMSIPPSYGPAAGDCAAQTAEPSAKDPVYFVSTGLPDCIKGKSLVFSVTRGTFRPYGETAPVPLRYGIATPGTATAPALLLARADAWRDRLQRDLRGAPPGHRVLLYVHGYNNTPAEALSAADQVAMAAHFEGPVIAFLWPSQRTLAKYTWDEENARWTQAYFDTVLTDLARIAPDIVLVSHSMGNRIAVDGLRNLQARAPDLADHVRTMVLASPDIDRELFDRDITPDIVRPGRHIALFASGQDLALRSSWAVHGNPRAGDVGCAFRLRRRAKPMAATRCYPTIIGDAGALTVIDGTDLKGSRMGHGTHIETPEGREALRRFLAVPASLPPGEKGVLLLRQQNPPDCTNGPSRLRLTYVTIRCGKPGK